MKRFSALILSLGVLAGCATVIEGQQQSISLRTPGAQDAECLFYNRDMRFMLRSGETRVINKSDSKLIADCRAAGNRRVEMVIEPALEKMAIGNVATGVIPGVGYDHLSKGMYVYPTEIIADFTNVKATAYPLPDYMRPELRDAYYGEMERYGPSTHRLPGEAPIPTIIEKRGENGITGNPFASSAPASPRLAPITEK